MTVSSGSGRSPRAAAVDAAWNFDDPRSSELRFRRLLRDLGRPSDADLRAEAWTQIARAQGLQRRFRVAHATLDRLAPALPTLAPRARIRYALERGRVLNSAGAPGKALPWFLAAWRGARRHGEDRLSVDAAHMVAIVRSGRVQRAWNVRALELAERSRDPAARRWRASLLNNLGWSWYDAGDYRAALRSFRRALYYRRRQGVPSETRVARWCVAKALRQLGRATDALRRQRRLAVDWRRAGGKDGYVFEELGECLLLLGRTREARPWFRRAHVELSRDPGLVAREPKRLARLLALGAADRRS